MFSSLATAYSTVCNRDTIQAETARPLHQPGREYNGCCTASDADAATSGARGADIYKVQPHQYVRDTQCCISLDRCLLAAATIQPQRLLNNLAARTTGTTVSFGASVSYHLHDNVMLADVPAYTQVLNGREFPRFGFAVWLQLLRRLSAARSLRQTCPTQIGLHTR